MGKHIFFALLMLIFLSACSDKRIAERNDYSSFMKQDLVKEKNRQISREITFWEQRLQNDTGNYVDMLELASCYSRQFKTTGQINSLRMADSLLKQSSSKLLDSDPDILFALSQAAISQHQFRKAVMYNNVAAKTGSRYINHLLAFDASMELGQYHEAEMKLDPLADRSVFDYLIREAKLEDHRGNLDKAITLMELAFETIKNKNEVLYCWALSNLGDMYGHAGRIRDAYQAYIKVLQKDNGYIYALKGIAWIAFSHDRNTEEAKRILTYILSQTNMPDLWLMLADIEEWEGNNNAKLEYIDRFTREVEKPAYGAMYNQYLIQLYVEELADHDKALHLAKKEIEERPTAETYDWLAWVYYNRGEKEKAFEIASDHVYLKTHEPDAAYHTAMIFLSNGKKMEAGKLLEECIESSFELGPVLSSKISGILASR